MASVNSVVLNLFRAVAHFKGLQVFVAHFHNIFDVMMAMPLGSASDLPGAEVISKKKSPVPRISGSQALTD